MGDTVAVIGLGETWEQDKRHVLYALFKAVSSQLEPWNIILSFRDNESALCVTYINERSRARLSVSHLRTIHPDTRAAVSPSSAFVCHLTQIVFYFIISIMYSIEQVCVCVCVCEREIDR